MTYMGNKPFHRIQISIVGSIFLALTIWVISYLVLDVIGMHQPFLELSGYAIGSLIYSFIVLPLLKMRKFKIKYKEVFRT